jgi:hypothetical protein
MATEPATNAVSIVVNKHGSLVHSDESGKETEYYIRDFLDFDAAQLAIAEDFKPSEGGLAVATETRLRGKAILDARYLSIIASPEKRAVEVALNIRDGNVPERIDEFRKNEYLKNLEKPFALVGDPIGVMFLGFNEGDWEFRTRDEFYVDLTLPKSAVSAICAALNAGKVKGISVHCGVAGLYTTEPPLAPYASPAPLFLGPDDKSLPVLRLAAGFVTRFTLTGPPIDLGSQVEAGQKNRIEAEPEDEFDESHEHKTNFLETLSTVDVRSNSSDTAIASLAANVAALRITLKWVGGLLIAVLLAFLVFK